MSITGLLHLQKQQRTKHMKVNMQKVDQGRVMMMYFSHKHKNQYQEKEWEKGKVLRTNQQASSLSCFKVAFGPKKDLTKHVYQSNIGKHPFCPHPLRAVRDHLRGSQLSQRVLYIKTGRMHRLDTGKYKGQQGVKIGCDNWTLTGTLNIPLSRHQSRWAPVATGKVWHFGARTRSSQAH